MRMIAAALLVLLLSVAAHGIISPAGKVHAMIGEGFLAYLEVSASFGQVSNCWFRYEKSEEVRLNLTATKPLLTERGELVLPYASTVCGIRVNRLSAASAGHWHLKVENVSGVYEQVVIEVGMLSKQPTQLETRVVREPGSGVIACSKQDTYTQHCTIYEPDTGKSWPQCQLLTTLRTNRSFECHVYNWGRLEPEHEIITVDVVLQGGVSNATHLETAEHELLSCQFEETVQSCQAVLPDGKQQLLIMDGMYNGRYSAYDTHILKSRCTLELPKPLQPHEQGLWRILNYRYTPPTGCLFYVGEPREQIIEHALTQLAKETRHINAYADQVSLGKLNCTLPFVVDECYLRDPNNTVYYAESLSFRRTSSYGQCSFSDLPLIAGIWTCGARSASYEKEVLQDIEVIVMSRQGEAELEKLKAKPDDSVELMCRSAFEMPITRCTYVDPESNVHLLATTRSIKTSGHVHYFGRGLEFGECGIRINKLTDVDFGRWRCQFGSNDLANDSIFIMWIKAPVSGQATSIGLGIGLTVIIVLVVGVIMATVFYRRNNLMAQHSFPSADPLEDMHAAPVTVVTEPVAIATSRL